MGVHLGEDSENGIPELKIKQKASDDTFQSEKEMKIESQKSSGYAKYCQMKRDVI